jgi:hypothetical protein
MGDYEREQSEFDSDEAEVESDTLKVPDEAESADDIGRTGAGASEYAPAEDPAEDAMGEAAGDTLKAPDADEG